MSRTVSLTLRTAANAEVTGEIPVFLLTVTHATLAEPVYLSTDPTERLSVDPLRYGTVSRGNTYDFLPIMAVLPDDSDATPPAIKLTMDNISRDLVPLLRSISGQAKVTIEMVLASDPDNVEVTWPEFDLVSAPYDALTVTVNLSMNALATEQYPTGSFSPGAFGGLF